MRRTMDAVRRDDVQQSLGGVRCPVLVVRGRHDHICPDEWARAIVAVSPPGSRVLTLASGGHMVPLTRGEMLAAAVAPHLA
jgi:pimeloyl-ACP methyl ester carboxylesterase